MNNNKPIKAMFLYTELAAYNQACFNTAIKRGNDIYIIRYPINSEAPYDFNNKLASDKLRSDFDSADSMINYIKEISPDVIIISGWKDKYYLKVASYFYNNIPTVLAFDNKWKASLKQQLSRLLSKKLLLNKFSHVWVPGNKQVNFAKKLGFKQNKIVTGFYSCDFSFFNDMYLKRTKDNNIIYNRTFLCVGRYLKLKGIFELWEAFIKLNDNINNEWKLICIGSGEEWKNRTIHSNIKHLGFVDINDMADVYINSSVYIMPSFSDAWGVSLHEAASAGLPVITTKNVGASEMFLKENINGFSIKAGSSKEILNAMIKFTKMNDEQLLQMSKESVNLSKKITPDIWVDKLMSIK